MAVISGWHGLDESMGPGRHIQRLDLVMGDLPGAQWVQNDRLIWSISEVLTRRIHHFLPFLTRVREIDVELRVLCQKCSLLDRWKAR